IPHSGTAIEAHLLLEGEIAVQFRSERADEIVGAHEHAPWGTSSTHSSRRSRSTLMYRFVDSALAWPSTADIVGSGTAARSSLDAALWRRKRVPAFTSATPALPNVSAVTL